VTYFNPQSKIILFIIYNKNIYKNIGLYLFYLSALYTYISKTKVFFKLERNGKLFGFILNKKDLVKKIKIILKFLI